MSPNLRPRFVLSSLALIWACCACTLDERKLVLSGAGGSTPLAAGAGAAQLEAGGAAPGENAGQGGEAGEVAGGASGFVNSCADLDGNGVSDCSETLLENATFDANVTQWEAHPGATIAWDAKDLLGASASGSALVTASGSMDSDGYGIAVAEQCLSVRDGTVLQVFANAAFDAGPVTGGAEIGMWFFAGEACSGDTPNEVYETPKEFTAGKTLTLRGAKGVSPQIKSVRVRLGVIKPFRAESFTVRFDNILLRAD